LEKYHLPQRKHTNFHKIDHTIKISHKKLHIVASKGPSPRF
jgi:hypothetical protein